MADADHNSCSSFSVMLLIMAFGYLGALSN